MTYSNELQQQLHNALEAKGPDYQPRTRHISQDGRPLYTNRLIFEDSPYLLQHAHNPVDWYPWGKEAFAAASAGDKPLFLSIGYATCHWCHVMEEESFESTVVADLLNAHYICIKVDREQYPDIDATYMTAVSLFTGHGGWPMSSFLCPDGKPFYSGTYYPQSSFINLLNQINQVWHQQRDTLLQQAERLADAVEQSAAETHQIDQLDQNLVSTAITMVLSQYDATHGGFSAAPKFPHEPLLLLILQFLGRQTHPQLASAMHHSLSAMAQGGIYDQVGGGFHRYSVDQYWLVPHFEKMLYNQAYLARVFLKAYCLSGDPLLERVVRQTLDYVLREMTDDRGLFYSATDADSEGEEGIFFVWSTDEIRRLLPEDDARFIIELYGMTDKGNFEGHNILYLPRSFQAVSQSLQLSLMEFFERLDPLIEQLREYRQKRIPPLTDDKILVAWNSMLITALAEAGHTLQEPRYLAAAQQAANALWQNQREGAGRLWRVNLQGKASVAARQEDYAHYTEALVALYDVTDKPAFLQQARLLCEEMLDQFLDTSSNAFHMGNEALLFTQPKDSYDGAQPSGNAVAVRVLSRLFKRTGNPAYAQQARNVLRSFAGHMNRQPVAYAYMLAQMDELTHGEIADYQYAGAGAIKLSGRLQTADADLTACIQLRMNKGWHLNSAPELTVVNHEDWTLLGTEIADDGEIKARIELSDNSRHETARKPVMIRATVQACNESSCLPADNVVITLYPGLSEY